MADSARAKKGLRTIFRYTDNVLFLVSSIIFATIILQTWVQVYSQLVSLANTDLWYISAFLLGYGSQSLIGEVMELSKKG
jgi:hypothetical protein